MENKFEELLRKTLSKEESEKLLRDIERDPNLKKEFEEYQEAWELVKVLERRKLKEKVSKIVANKSNAKIQNKRWVWYVAASILLLITCYWAFYQDASGEQIAQTYFEPYPDKFTSMGQNSPLLTKAMAAYNNQHYQEAENIFSQLPTELLNEVEFYRGICLYQLDKKDEAKAIFRKYKQDPTSTYYEASLWYFSLTHLALNENDSAITLLNKVKNDPLISFHKEDAMEIIKQLK